MIFKSLWQGPSCFNFKNISLVIIRIRLKISSIRSISLSAMEKKELPNQAENLQNFFKMLIKFVEVLIGSFRLISSHQVRSRDIFTANSNKSWMKYINIFKKSSISMMFVGTSNSKAKVVSSCI